MLAAGRGKTQIVFYSFQRVCGYELSLSPAQWCGFFFLAVPKACRNSRVRDRSCATAVTWAAAGRVPDPQLLNHQGTPWFWASSFQSCEKINFCCFTEYVVIYNVLSISAIQQGDPVISISISISIYTHTYIHKFCSSIYPPSCSLTSD